jgi:hypothetical protein
MLNSHVLIATQKLETRGLLWPSKLAPMLVLPRAIIWVGPTDGAVAQAIRERGEPHGIIAPGEDEQLTQWLIATQTTLLHSPTCSVESLHERLTQSRENALETWRSRLDRVASPSAA